MDYSAQEIHFFLNHLYTRADDIYRFCLFQLGDEEKAQGCVSLVYDELLPELSELEAEEELNSFLLASCWVAVQSTIDQGSMQGRLPESLQTLQILTKVQRAILFAVDFWGLDPVTSGSCLGLNPDTSCATLVQGREQLIAHKVEAMTSTALSDQEFFDVNVAEFLNNTLDEETNERFNNMLKEKQWNLRLERFRKRKGQFQLALKSIHLPQEQCQDLHSKVESQEAIALHQMRDIQNISTEQRLGRNKRIATLCTLGVIALMAIYYMVTPKAQPAHQILQSLAYDVVLLEEAHGASRLEFPSPDLEQIRGYFKSYVRFDFTPPVLELGPEWDVEGATILKDDGREIGVTQFKHNAQYTQLFHFFLVEKLNHLPESKEGQLGDFRYRAYGSDEINMIAWQHPQGPLQILAGRHSVQDLAQWAAGR